MRRAAEYARRDGFQQLAIAVGAAVAYELARRLTRPNWTIADANARRIWHVERMLHLAVERQIQDALLGAPWLLRMLDGFYLLGHFALTALVLVWLYRRSRPEFARLRDALLSATGIALVVHWLFPAAPPRLARLGFSDTLRALLGVDIGSPGHAALSNPVAAVPSLHAGYAVGVALALWRVGPRAARILAILYPSVVVLTIVATGNHFLLDAIAGAVLVGAAFTLQPRGAWLYFRLRRGVEQPGSSPGS